MDLYLLELWLEVSIIEIILANTSFPTIHLQSMIHLYIINDINNELFSIGNSNSILHFFKNDAMYMFFFFSVHFFAHDDIDG